jgi:uncharacterized protein
VTVLYADTSALVRAYFADEPEHDHLRRLLLDGEDPVVTADLTRVELASAVAAARRGGRLRRPRVVLDRFDADCGEEGLVTMLRLDPDEVFPVARDLLLAHDLRTLDAVHLALARTTAAELAGDGELCLVTRDARQQAAALGLGMVVR